jgi:putative FmdB family regulatory protein
MGIIIREFQCADCEHKFESSDPIEEVVCPQCSSGDAERAFFTPPGIRSPQTNTADKELKNLANDYGLTNMTNAGGAAVKRAPDGPAAPNFAAGPQATQTLAAIQRLGAKADGFSGVLPALQNAGRPHQWRKTPERSR